ncbi:hypothetical protein [uncultured Piscinibacter sp.]|uniref:hypothetical protein n=1 Tax=uncultured Piscinibacter sp. TaxID=1131835 RepID=UPI00261F4A21|nr:hypothetical protein [uncultured Piscinibacter sp.]
MTDAWAFLVSLLVDPPAGRLVIERLQRLPATIRGWRCRNDLQSRRAAMLDIQHAPLWRALAREVEPIEE